MLTYRATLRPRAATRSPWQADMLFGHLCWLIRYEEGEGALRDLLGRYQAGEPPLLLSDGFPAGWLPRPLLPQSPPSGAARRGERIGAARAAKQDARVRWLREASFQALRHGQSAPSEPDQPDALRRVVLKNQINRLTGTTAAADEGPGGGALYSAEELVYVQRDGLEQAGLDVAVYVRVVDEAWAERAREALARLARGGYGAKKSAGYGQFALAHWQPYAGFDTPVGVNGFISLSNWVPHRDDPTDGFYTTLVKYGKLGEELANVENPFKFPLTMLAAGASFYAPSPRAWYGRLVEGIAPGASEVVHYGYAFAVPAALPDVRPAP